MLEHTVHTASYQDTHNKTALCSSEFSLPVSYVRELVAGSKVRAQSWPFFLLIPCFDYSAQLQEADKTESNNKNLKILEAVCFRSAD